MLIQKVPHYVDSILTQEVASSALQGGDVVVAWYTNQTNKQSVVHSHPYYELILPVSGSSVRYSVGGSVYDLPGDAALSGVTAWRAGVLADECAEVMRDFFAKKRINP